MQTPCKNPCQPCDTTDAILACTHHYRLEEPRGEFSLGTCKLCGSKKQFRNWEGLNFVDFGRSDNKPRPRTSTLTELKYSL